MKRNKLNFEEISQSMEVLDQDSQRGVKGGLSAAELLADIAANGISKYAGKTFSFDGGQNGFSYVNDTYYGGVLPEVVVTAGPSGNSGGGSSSSFWSSFSSGTGSGHSFTDYMGLAGTIGEPIGTGSGNILDHRGVYMPKGEIYGLNKEITIRTMIGNINSTSEVLNYARVGGKVLGFLGVVSTGAQVYNDWSGEKYYSAGTRVAVFGIGAAAAFIPVVGWGVAAGIGIADFIWGDEFYDYVEDNMR